MVLRVLRKVVGLAGVGFMCCPVVVLAQLAQPVVPPDQPTCEERLLASKKGLVNVALQVTDLEAQTEHLRKRLEAVTRERDAALAKVKPDEQPSKASQEK